MKNMRRLSWWCWGIAACVSVAQAEPTIPAQPVEASAAVHQVDVSKKAAEHVTARTAQRERPFDFRGIPLGITLDAFLASRISRASPSNSTPLCDTDVAAADIGLDLKSEQSLTVACRWAHRVGAGWQASRAVVAGSLAQEHVLRFVKLPGQSTFHLYEISLVVDDITANDLRDGLTSRFGAPNTAAPVAASSSSAMRVYTWENAVSTVTLCFLPQSHNGTLTYVLKAPDMWLKSMVKQWQDAGTGTG